MHDVPLRLAVELGILSAVVRVGLALGGLWRRPDARWWMLAAVAGLSMMYYLTWIPLCGLWWLLFRRRGHHRGKHKPLAGTH